MAPERRGGLRGLGPELREQEIDKLFDCGIDRRRETCAHLVPLTLDQVGSHVLGVFVLEQPVPEGDGVVPAEGVEVDPRG